MKFFVRIKTFFKRSIKKIALDRCKALAIALFALALICFAIIASTTPLVFSADITFDTGGGTAVDDLTIRTGRTLPKTSIPQKEYYSFGGWYYDDDFSHPYSNEKIKKDIKLYAKWNTIFTKEFFQKKVDLINDIYGTEVLPEDAIKTERPEMPVEDDPVLEAILNELDVKLMFNFESNEVLILAMVLSNPDDAPIIIDHLNESTDEYVLQMLKITIRGDAVFVSIGELYRVLFDEIVRTEDYIFSTTDYEEYNIIKYLGEQKQVIIPELFNGKPVTSIGSLAFYRKEIETIDLPNSLEDIAFGAFFNVSQLKEIVFPSAIKEIKTGTLVECDQIERIVLPDGLEKCDFGAFVDLPSIKEIIIDEGNEHYQTLDGVLFNGDMTALLLYPAKKPNPSYIVPEGILEIGMAAFSSASDLQSVTLPESLRYIYASAFSDSGLENIYIPKNIEYIGASAFARMAYDYNNLQSVVFAPDIVLKTIDMNAFRYSLIEEISLPSSLQTIGIGAFENCNNLAQIVFEEGIGIESLADNLFSKCQALESIILPESVIEIGKAAFADCINLKNISITQSNKIINDRAFSSCSSLNSVFLPSGTEKIGERAFENCTGLTQIVLPSQVKELETDILRGCISLTEVNLPYIVSQEKSYMQYYFGVSNMGLSASLKKVTVSADFSQLPDRIFENCLDIEEILLPQTVSVIGEAAFGNCSKLSLVNLSDSIFAIGKDAFRNCISLGEITLPAALQSIGECAFAVYGYEETNTTEILINSSNVLQEIGLRAFDSSKIKGNLTFGSQLNSISDYAFFQCNSIQNVVINNNNALIGKNVFQNCQNIKSMTVPLKNNYVMDTNSYLGYYFGGGDYYANFTVPASLTTVNIISGIQKIPDYAFYYCNRITNISLPNGINSIGNYAFYECNALVGVESASKNIDTVGNFAFYRCQSLPIIDFSSSLHSIGESAFEECSSLSSIDLSSAIAVGQRLLRNCVNLEEMTVPLVEPYAQHTNSYLYYYFGGNGADTNNIAHYSEKLKTVNITNNGTTTISDNAFKNFKYVESINLPAGLTSIGNNAFYYCEALKEISLPSTVQTIGDFAFRSCIGLESIDIPVGTKQIGRNAFENCSSLVSVNFPQNSEILDIGESAFSQCSALGTISLPDYSVYQIADRTFYKCVSLKQFVFPTGLQYIRVAAFEESGLTSISIPRTVQQIGIFAFKNCKMLTEIVFEEPYSSMLNTIERESFLGCELLTEVVFPTSLLAIVGDTFKDCINLKKVVVLREFNYLLSWQFMATALNSGGVFDNCHSELKIYVPKNNAGVTEDNAETGAKNGVTMYKQWFSWADYQDIIFELPEEWFF